MAFAGVVDTRFNPNDKTQRVVLWGNGRIDVYNTAPVTDAPEFYPRLDQPVVVAIHIVTWGDTTAGYVLDKQGGFHPFGGAPAIGTKSTVRPTDTHYVVTGVPYWPAGIYKDWAWDPNNAGRGVVLDGFGTLHDFGGAPQAPRGLNRWTTLVAKKLKMQWTPDVRAYTLDHSGGIHHDYAAAPAPGITRALQAHLRQPGDFPYWLFNDAARDFVITDWDSAPSGYTLHKSGSVHAWGTAEPAIGYPRGSGDWARSLQVMNPDNPLQFWHVGSGGQQSEWVASTPPTVTAGGGVSPYSPADPTTGTTRPALTWAYTDPQRDEQAEVLVMVFTQAYVTANNMADPYAHRPAALVDLVVTDPNARGVACPVDLQNGAYRLYVAAKDTAGQWSPWSNRGWTQNVPVPATPTGMTATASPGTLSVGLSVTVPGTVASLVRFEYQDAGETSWKVIQGADAVTRAATTTAVDRFPPQGKARTYRAVAYNVDPRTASAPSNTAVATLSTYVYALHAVDNSNIGGEVAVTGPLEWIRPVTAGVFSGLGAEYPTIISDGSPKARRGTLTVLTESRAQWSTIEALAEADSILVLRDPFGEVVYCRLVGDWTQRLLEAIAPLGEPQALRHMHSTALPLVEVRPPNLEA